MYCLELWPVLNNAWSCLVTRGKEHYNKIKCQLSINILVYLCFLTILWNVAHTIYLSTNPQWLPLQYCCIDYQASFPGRVALSYYCQPHWFIYLMEAINHIVCYTILSWIIMDWTFVSFQLFTQATKLDWWLYETGVY